MAFDEQRKLPAVSHTVLRHEYRHTRLCRHSGLAPTHERARVTCRASTPALGQRQAQCSALMIAVRNAKQLAVRQIQARTFGRNVQNARGYETNRCIRARLDAIVDACRPRHAGQVAAGEPVGNKKSAGRRDGRRPRRILVLQVLTKVSHLARRDDAGVRLVSSSNHWRLKRDPHVHPRNS
jgi:hypothetical protein